ISFAALSQLQERVGTIIQNDPEVASVAMRVGGGSGGNTGTMYVTLKPRSERRLSADQIIRRLAGQFTSVAGARVFLQAAQDLRTGGRQSRAQYQLALTSPDLAA